MLLSFLSLSAASRVNFCKFDSMLTHRSLIVTIAHAFTSTSVTVAIRRSSFFSPFVPRSLLSSRFSQFLQYELRDSNVQHLQSASALSAHFGGRQVIQPVQMGQIRGQELVIHLQTLEFLIGFFGLCFLCSGSSSAVVLLSPNYCVPRF